LTELLRHRQLVAPELRQVLRKQRVSQSVAFPEILAVLSASLLKAK
jgi:hypothetical protein